MALLDILLFCKSSNRADQQDQNKRFSEVQRLFNKAQFTFNKILPGEKTESINRALAQAWLNYGDSLRDRGALKEAQVSYEAAQPFNSSSAVQRLTINNGLIMPDKWACVYSCKSLLFSYVLFRLACIFSSEYSH